MRADNRLWPADFDKRCYRYPLLFFLIRKSSLRACSVWPQGKEPYVSRHLPRLV